MKKIAVFLLASVAVITVAGCIGKGKGKGKAPAITAPAEPVVRKG